MRLIRLKPYIRAMKAMGFNEAEMQSVEADIAASWRQHPIVQGLKGVRKARIARPGTGKSGGAGILYYFAVGDHLQAMLTAYAKSAKSDLSNEDRKAILQALSNLRHGDEK
jgi:hypothetical protein